MPSNSRRLLFSVRGSYGHVYPLLPLAFALRDAGHDIRFATAGEFVTRLRRIGFDTVAAGWTMREVAPLLADRPDLRDVPRDEMWRLGSFFFGRAFATATAADLAAMLPGIDPDLVVYEEYDLGAALAARAAGIPAIGHALGRPPSDVFRGGLARELAGVWNEMSDEPFVDPFTTDPYVDITPPALRGPATMHPARRLCVRPVSVTDDDAPLPEWVREPRRRPLVYVTLGTVSNGAVDSLQRVVGGLAPLDVDVLVTIGPGADVDALGPLPPSVRAVPFVPQDALLPYVDLAVHHCGSGTMLGMLARGIPQLVIPHGADQFMNADTLVDAGAGLRLYPEEITAGAVTDAVRTLMREHSYAVVVGNIRREIASMPPPESIVPEIVAIAGGTDPALRARSA